MNAIIMTTRIAVGLGVMVGAGAATAWAERQEIVKATKKLAGWGKGIWMKMAKPAKTKAQPKRAAAKAKA